MKSRIYHSHFFTLSAFGLAFIAFAVYSPFLWTPQFVWDDIPIIAENSLLRSWASLTHLLSSGYWEGVIGSGATVQEYRPLTMFSYFLTEHIVGLTPLFFRIFNILLHACNAALLLRLLRKRMPEKAAFVAAMFFVILPNQGEVAGIITGRSESLMLLFLLLCWLELDHQERFSTFSGVFFACALLSKESAVMFPFLWAMSEFVFKRGEFFDRKCLRSFLPMLTMVAGSIGLRWIVLRRVFHGGDDYFAGVRYAIRLLTVAKFFFTQSLVSLAAGLRFRIDYSRPMIPNSSLQDWRSWLALTVGLFLIGIAVYALVRKRSPSAFWILWAFAFWLPTSNLLVKLDTLGAGRFLYVPSIGYCVILAHALLTKPSPPKKVFLVTLMTWYMVVSHARSRVWATQLGIAQWMVKTNPFSNRGWESLGCYYLSQQNWSDARPAFEKAVELDSRRPENYYNLGILEYQQRNFPVAKKYFLTACSLNPRDPDTWEHLGAIAQIEGEKSTAIRNYLQVLALRPYHATSHYNLGRLFMETGHLDLAVFHYREFLALTPGDADAGPVRALLERIHRDHSNL